MLPSFSVPFFYRATEQSRVASSALDENENDIGINLWWSLVTILWQPTIDFSCTMLRYVVIQNRKARFVVTVLVFKSKAPRLVHLLLLLRLLGFVVSAR